MAFSLSKIFKQKPTIDPSLILNQIDYKEGTKYAENSTNKIYIDIEELGGFPYLKTVLFGVNNINIKRTGCTISFLFRNDSLTLTSDNTTIESVGLQKSGVYYTPVDFELSEEESKKLKSNKVLDVEYRFKKNTINLKPI